MRIRSVFIILLEPFCRLFLMPLTSKAANFKRLQWTWSKHKICTELEKWMFEAKVERKKDANKVIQLRFELAALKSIHESLKLEVASTMG